MRPFTHHERELDAAVVGALQRLEAELSSMRTRSDERIERLEQISRELILASESLRRAGADTATSLDTVADRLGELQRTVEGLLHELNQLPYMDGEPFTFFQAEMGRGDGLSLARGAPAGSFGLCRVRGAVPRSRASE